MASVTRPTCSRPALGGHDRARTSRSKATRPHLSPSLVATVVTHITASMACSTRGTPATGPAMTLPLSSRSTIVWLRSAR